MNLAELIRSTKGDRSYEQLARDCGGRPTSQRLQQIATTQLKAFPDGETILNLSRGLAVEVRTVVLAAAASLGLPVGGSTHLADLLPPAAAHLTDRQVAAVRAVVNAMNDPTERSGGDDATSMTTGRSGPGEATAPEQVAAVSLPPETDALHALPGGTMPTSVDLPRVPARPRTRRSKGTHTRPDSEGRTT